MKQMRSNLRDYYLTFTRLTFILLLVVFQTSSLVNAQDELDVIHSQYAGCNDGRWLIYSDAHNSLYKHLTGQAYDILARRAREISELSSLTGWQQRQNIIRKNLLELIGPFPEKTPLNAKITRVVEKDSFRIEHIVYESQPGFYVTSSLFIPTWLKKRTKSPAIIYCSGHSNTGYRGYQNVILNLVKKGFIVFAFDPVGQGERLGYFDPQKKGSIVGGPTKEHSYPGTQAFITGSSLARHMTWDGIRAVDYLLSRKEIDPARIGITGRSGGGTQSAFIAAMDERIYAAAPECYITNFTRLLQMRGPQDAEQNLINFIQRGLDQPDLLLVRAPKPSLMITTTNDMFSIQGVLETEKEVSRIYKAYGKEDNFSRTEDEASHESTKKNREAMYSFFQKHLNNPGNPKDEIVRPVSPEEMQVTATGQVSTSLAGETIYSLNCKEAEKLQSQLQAARNDIDRHLPQVLNSAKTLSGYNAPSGTQDPVITGRITRDGYIIEKYFVKGEGDYVIPFLLMVPGKSNNKAIIYLHPEGKKPEASLGGEMEWFAKNGYMVLAPDLIGSGETGPADYRGDADIDGVSHNLWYGSILTGRSILGIRVGDLL